MSAERKICPKCGKSADWKTYIQKYVCTYCGWTGEVRSVFYCADCDNSAAFEVKNHPGADELILVICKECGSVVIKHREYIDDNTRLKLALSSDGVIRS